MEKLLTFILESFVQKPEKIKVTETETKEAINLDFSVDKEDIGRVIGKGGNIIKAIRTVLRIHALKIGKRVNLNLVER